MSTKKKYFVVVTTEKQGVFAGYLKKHDTERETCILEDAQMCVYWSSDIHGVLGLAKTGPLQDCKITPVIPEIYLNGITSIMICTKESEKNWRKELWD